jgi:hypothetical protein
VIRGDRLSSVQIYFLLDDEARLDDLIVVEKLPLFYRGQGEHVRVAADVTYSCNDNRNSASS